MSDGISPHLSNTFWLGNRVSGACHSDKVNQVEANLPFVDRYFGNSWSWTPTQGAALYGITERLPSAPIEQHGNGEFLRVPYRRIPIIEISNLSDLYALAGSARSKDPSVTGVWRGQSHQYLIPREEDELMRLYGVADPCEPSLLPSASRSDVYFPDLLAAWSGLLDVFVGQRLAKLATDYSTSAARLLSEKQNFEADYNYRLWSIATAQHYGLPSVGLDLTPDIGIALFFALHSFNIDKSTGLLAVERVERDAEPIIYGLGVFENDLLIDERLAPGWLECARPKAQKANFFGTAWGHSSNKAAERVHCAVRIVEPATWKSPYSVDDLFPSGPSDPFVEFMVYMKGKQLDDRLSDLLSRIYFRA